MSDRILLAEKTAECEALKEKIADIKTIHTMQMDELRQKISLCVKNETVIENQDLKQKIAELISKNNDNELKLETRVYELEAENSRLSDVIANNAKFTIKIEDDAKMKVKTLQSENKRLKEKLSEYEKRRADAEGRLRNTRKLHNFLHYVSDNEDDV